MHHKWHIALKSLFLLIFGAIMGSVGNRSEFHINFKLNDHVGAMP